VPVYEVPLEISRIKATNSAAINQRKKERRTQL